MNFKEFTQFVGSLFYGDTGTNNSDDALAVIRPRDNGRYGLYYQGGALIKDYARARDARRAAGRLGLELA